MTTRFSCCLALLLLASGCSAFDDPSDVSALWVCRDDAGCDAGRQCVVGWCVDPASEPLKVALQLRFPSSGSDLRRQVTGLLFEPGLAMPDILEQPLVPIQVEVTRRTASVSSRVRFRAQRAIPDSALEVWAQTSGEGGQLDLLPGTYEVTVFPSESSPLPARTFRGIEVSTDPEGTQITLPLVQVDLGERLVVLEGVLLFLVDGTEVPAKDVRVEARSLDGLYSSSTVLSCSETTCDGGFSMMLPAQLPDETRVFQLRVEPTESSSDLPSLTLPEFEIGPSQLEKAVVINDDSLRVDAGTFRASGQPAFTRVSGRVEAEDTGEPISGVILEVHGTLDNASYVTRVEEPTAEDGTFEIQIAQTGAFELLAIPPQQSKYASRLLELGSVAQIGTLTLERKMSVSGVVYGRFTSVPVPDVAISAVPLATKAGDNADLSRRVETLTNSDGGYILYLEPGSYRLHLVPNPSSGLPRATRRIEITESREDEDILLGRTSVIYGYVFTADGEPASGVTVEVFAHEPLAGRAELIGAGTTNDQGSYRLVIPNTDDYTLSD